MQICLSPDQYFVRRVTPLLQIRTPQREDSSLDLRLRMIPTPSSHQSIPTPTTIQSMRVLGPQLSRKLTLYEVWVWCPWRCLPSTTVCNVVKMSDNHLTPCASVNLPVCLFPPLSLSLRAFPLPVLSLSFSYSPRSLFLYASVKLFLPLNSIAIFHPHIELMSILAYLLPYLNCPHSIHCTSRAP